jgi:arginyl-tRNA synthetase
MSDKFIIQCQILETKKVKDLDVATKVLVTLQTTDESAKAKDRVVKKSEKEGLYSAMDLAAVWLERALAAK